MTQTEPRETETAPAEPELSKSDRINLGIDLLHALREPGKRCIVEEIAAWCDCSEGAIKDIAKKTLDKLRRRLRKAGVNRETLAALVTRCSCCWC